MNRDNFTDPVPPANTPRARRARRDPDQDTQTPADPTPAAAPTATGPNGPGPTDPTPPPDPPTAPPTTPGNGVAHNPGGTLGPVLAPNTNTTTTNTSAPNSSSGIQDSVAVLAGLARMRQNRVDPYNDWVADGTRNLRWVQAAIEHYAQLNGRTRQDVQTRALLGIEPIPADVLEANWLACYGYPRSQYQPPNTH
jgi:hypothetical protein